MRQEHISGTRLRHAAIAPILCLVASAAAQAAYRDDIHYTQLQAELGGSTPTGAGVPVSQVEGDVEVNGEAVWMADPNNGEFVGKTLTDVSGGPPGLYSGHATAVGQQLYGAVSSIAPGITNVLVYWANGWLSGDFLRTDPSPGIHPAPASSTSRIGNHSWIGDAQDAAVNSDALRRLDWVIENDDFIHVAAQGGSIPLLSTAFNVIAVSTTDGGYATGTAAVDADYVAGRVHPNIVIPGASLSEAAPRVSAGIALLVQTGGNSALSTDLSQTSYTNRAGVLIRNAQRAEVIKAALMAGADRVTRNTTSGNLALYRGAGYQSVNGLDSRYGAGQVNIHNSYHIIASGEQNSTQDGGPGSGTIGKGFDWDRFFGGLNGSNTTGTYPLPVSATPRLLTAALVWHLDIDGGTASNFDSDATARDLALSVVDVTGGGPGVTVFTSQSTVDNTENVWLVVPANAAYQLRVTVGSGPAFRYDYGLAWQLMSDTDSDGAYDAQDNCTNADNGPIAPDAGANSQRDTNGDGYGNICDADLNNTGLVTSADYTILRNLLNTSNADADLNGSGLVTSADYTILRSQLNQPPGPSAFAP